MVIMPMLMNHKTNTCRKFMTLIRFMKDDDDDNDDDADIQNEKVPHVCDTYSLYKR